MPVSKARFFALIVPFVIALVAVPVAFAELNGSKGPVDAYNYDEQKAAQLSVECSQKFECKPTDMNGAFFYGCHYDVISAECQCSSGEFSRCNVTASVLDPWEAKKAGGSKRAVAGLVLAPFKLAFSAFGRLPLPARAAIVIGLVAAAIFIFLRTRNTPSNNLRRAQSLHARATALHEKGQEDEARILFEKSNYYREKANGEMQ